MKRLSKYMAAEAAKKLASKVYDKRVEEAKNLLLDASDTILRKYVPAPIWGCFKDYPDFFGSPGTWIHVKSESSKSKYTGYMSLDCRMRNPNYGKVFLITDKEYDELESLDKKWKTLSNQRKQYADDVENALLQLKTFTRIKESFPEALPYLDFVESTQLAPNFAALRNPLKCC